MVWPVVIALTATAPTVGLTAAAGSLGAARFADREHAAQTLRDAGPLAVGPLTVASRSPDSEVRRRATSLLERIEAERTGTPTLVNLHADHLPVAAVVRELARQTGYPLVLSPEATPTDVTLHRRQVPFWAAVDALCDAAKLAVSLHDDGRIELAPADTTDPFVCYAGPFRITATEVGMQKDRRLAGVPRRGLPPAEPERLSVSLCLTAEPKAMLLGVGPAPVHVADDDRGLSLKVSADDAGRTVSAPPWTGDRSLGRDFGLLLEPRDRTATAIRRLRGTVTVSVLSGTLPDAVLTDPGAKGRSARGRLSSLTVEGVAVTDGLYTLDLTATRTAAGSDEGWFNGLPQRLELTGGDGQAWPFVGLASLRGEPPTVRLAAQFRPPTPDAKPARLTLVEWRTVTRDVPFEFNDIPLP